MIKAKIGIDANRDGRIDILPPEIDEFFSGNGPTVLIKLIDQYESEYTANLDFENFRKFIKVINQIYDSWKVINSRVSDINNQIKVMNKKEEEDG